MTTFFVDIDDGSPSNDGTQASPFQHLNNAVSVAGDSDKILIKCSDTHYEDFSSGGDIGDGGQITGIDNLTIDRYAPRWYGDLPIFHYVRNNGSTWSLNGTNNFVCRNLRFKGKDAYNASFLFSRNVRFGTLGTGSSNVLFEFCHFDNQENNTGFEVEDGVLVDGLTIRNCYAHFGGDVTTHAGAVRFVNTASTVGFGIKDLTMTCNILANWEQGVLIQHHGVGNVDDILIKDNQFIGVGYGADIPAVQIENMEAGATATTTNNILIAHTPGDANARGIDIRNYTAGTVTANDNSFHGYGADYAGAASTFKGVRVSGLGALDCINARPPGTHWTEKTIA